MAAQPLSRLPYACVWRTNSCRTLASRRLRRSRGNGGRDPRCSCRTRIWLPHGTSCNPSLERVTNHVKGGLSYVLFAGTAAPRYPFYYQRAVAFVAITEPVAPFVAKSLVNFVAFLSARIALEVQTLVILVMSAFSHDHVPEKRYKGLARWSVKPQAAARGSRCFQATAGASCTCQTRRTS